MARPENMAMPNVASDLNLGGSLTPEQIEERRKKLMMAGQSQNAGFMPSVYNALFGKSY
jgi:hypothetical protein